MGRVTAISERSIVLSGRGVRILDIQAVESRSRSGGGAMTGAIAGTVLVSTFAVAVVGHNIGLNVTYVLGSVGFGVLVGAPVGGIAGHVLAPPSNEWRLIWPSSR